MLNQDAGRTHNHVGDGALDIPFVGHAVPNPYIKNSTEEKCQVIELPRSFALAALTIS